MEVQTAPAYNQIVATLFQKSPLQGEGQMVAVTSANSGEGVSYIVRTLATRLALHPLHTVAVVPASALAEYTGPPELITDSCNLQQRGNIFTLTLADDRYANAKDHSLWHASVRYRADCLQQLRQRFSYILIDCPPPKLSGDLFTLAALVDSVLVVVEANRTKKEQIRNVERTVEAARGNIAGYVVNKREYIVPEWLYTKI